MTKDEILNMQAGYKLDTLVAEKVMGWHIEDHMDGFRSSWVDSRGYYQCSTLLSDSDYLEFEDSEDIHLLYWHPSISILWAWEIVNKFSDRGELFNIYRLGGNATGWRCQFGKGGVVEEKTPELAICKSALIAICVSE